MNIMLIEDEKKIRDMLRLYLEQENHHVMAFSHAEEALKTFALTPVDVVITDLMLPGIQGESLLKRIRETSAVYVLVITAKNTDEDKLKLLKDGADDFIAKPFKIEEILYKLNNIQKRLYAVKTVTCHIQDHSFVFDENDMRVTVDDAEIQLNKTECDLLLYFIKHPKQTLSRQQIIDHVLSESDAYDRIVDTYVKTLRRKLRHKSIIETVYGAGYKFKGVCQHD